LRDFTKEKGRGAKSKTIFLTSENRIFNTCQKSRRGMDKMEEGFCTVQRVGFFPYHRPIYRGTSAVFSLKQGNGQITVYKNIFDAGMISPIIARVMQNRIINQEGLKWTEMRK
jgi:hypothetical protein